MRFVLAFCLLIILANFQHTTAEYCRCECCTGNSCTPVHVGTYSLNTAFCSESVNCKINDCNSNYSFKCPRLDSPGQTRPTCVSNSERILPTLFLIIGMNLIIRVIKDKF